MKQLIENHINSSGIGPIKVLCDYYDVLSAQNKLIPEQYTDEGIDYVLLLNHDGELVDIIDYHHEELRMNGKKEKIMTVQTIERLPKRVQKKDTAYPLDHRGKYIFGLKAGKEHFSSSTTEQKAFESFITLNMELTKGLDTPLIKAYRKFMKRWQPTENLQNPVLLPLLKKFELHKFILALVDEPMKFIHNDPAWIEHWTDIYNTQDIPSKHLIQDSITGQQNQLNTRIHEKIKRLPGGLSQGNSLVAFKYDSYMSYNHENQNANSTDYNANISYKQMLKYTAALNYILDTQQYIKIKQLVIIPIVLNKTKNMTDNLLGWLNNLDNQEDQEKQLQNYIQSRLCQAKTGLINKKQLIDLEDYNTDVYLLGLEANAARIMVKLFIHQSFGKIVQNIADFQTEIQMTEIAKPVSLYTLIRQTMPNDIQESDERLANHLLTNIIRNNTIPQSIYRQIIRRILIEPDSLNNVKIGMIKKYLNDIGKEITMTLNTNTTETAYIYGQIFAVVERAQYLAQGKINRTLKDQYFRMALSRPSRVFPRLITMMHKYLKKINRNNKAQHNYLNKQLGDLIVKLGNSENLTKLSDREKGLFIMGYYQQREIFYKSIKDNDK